MARHTGFLGSGEFLAAGDYLVSSHDLYFAIVQVDGNFCVYEGDEHFDEYRRALLITTQPDWWPTDESEGGDA